MSQIIHGLTGILSQSQIGQGEKSGWEKMTVLTHHLKPLWLVSQQQISPPPSSQGRWSPVSWAKRQLFAPLPHQLLVEPEEKHFPSKTFFYYIPPPLQFLFSAGTASYHIMYITFYDIAKVYRNTRGIQSWVEIFPERKSSPFMKFSSLLCTRNTIY